MAEDQKHPEVSSDSPSQQPAEEAANTPESTGRFERSGVGGNFIRSSLRIALLAIGPLVIIAVGGFYYATSGRHIE